jgi:hypothetical protein
VLARYLKFVIYIKRFRFIILGVGRSVFLCIVVVWVLGIVTQYSGIILGFSGIAEFISIWEVYIGILDSVVGSRIVVVITCINNLSAKFAAILVTVVQGRVLMDVKNNLLFLGIGAKGVNSFSSIVRVCIVFLGYLLIFLEFESLGYSSE